MSYLDPESDPQQIIPDPQPGEKWMIRIRETQEHADLDPDPQSGWVCLFFTYPGSKGQKGTGSRIRNTDQTTVWVFDVTEHDNSPRIQDYGSKFENGQSSGIGRNRYENC
jgi:hypothetical protein